MYRLCALICEEIKSQNTDVDMKSFLEVWDFDTFSVKKDDCLSKFKPWLSKNKEYIAEEAYKSAVANDYILEQADGYITLNRKHGTGADLVEGHGWGFVRALISKEWKYVTVFLLAVGWMIGYITAIAGK